MDNQRIVIFRIDREGIVFALFPELPSDYQGFFCTAYQHIGQHCAADFQLCICEQPPRPKLPCQSANEFRQTSSTNLSERGYHLWQVHQRATPLSCTNGGGGLLLPVAGNKSSALRFDLSGIDLLKERNDRQPLQPFKCQNVERSSNPRRNNSQDHRRPRKRPCSLGTEAVGFQQRGTAQQRLNQETLSWRESLCCFSFTPPCSASRLPGGRPLIDAGNRSAAPSIVGPIMLRQGNGAAAWPSTSQSPRRPKSPLTTMRTTPFGFSKSSRSSTQIK